MRKKEGAQKKASITTKVMISNSKKDVCHTVHSQTQSLVESNDGKKYDYSRASLPEIVKYEATTSWCSMLLLNIAALHLSHTPFGCFKIHLQIIWKYLKWNFQLKRRTNDEITSHFYYITRIAHAIVIVHLCVRVCTFSRFRIHNSNVKIYCHHDKHYSKWKRANTARKSSKSKHFLKWISLCFWNYIFKFSDAKFSKFTSTIAICSNRWLCWHNGLCDALLSLWIFKWHAFVFHRISRHIRLPIPPNVQSHYVKVNKKLISSQCMHNNVRCTPKTVCTISIAKAI